MFVSQCRKYKASEKVRRRADVIYHKFKKLFTIKEGDDFTKVFLLFVMNDTFLLSHTARQQTVWYY